MSASSSQNQYILVHRPKGLGLVQSAGPLQDGLGTLAIIHGLRDQGCA